MEAIDLSKQAEAELKQYLWDMYGTDWNFPNEYYKAALHMTKRAIEAEAKLKGIAHCPTPTISA